MKKLRLMFTISMNNVSEEVFTTKTDTQNMYEVEIKVELTDKERQELIDNCKERNFIFKKVTPQNDYYIEAKESSYGGFDLKRYRNEVGEFIYTEKVWELIDGQPYRRETEYVASKEEFESKITQYPHALKIVKDREWFSGLYKGIPISLTIDTVKFDHSQAMRYFTEAEIDIEEKKDVPQTKEFIKNFLKEILNKQEIIEAPGMFTMAFKKL